MSRFVQLEAGVSDTDGSSGLTSGEESDTLGGFVRMTDEMSSESESEPDPRAIPEHLFSTSTASAPLQKRPGKQPQPRRALTAPLPLETSQQEQAGGKRATAGQKQAVKKSKPTPSESQGEGESAPSFRVRKPKFLLTYPHMYIPTMMLAIAIRKFVLSIADFNPSSIQSWRERHPKVVYNIWHERHKDGKPHTHAAVHVLYNNPRFQKVLGEHLTFNGMRPNVSPSKNNAHWSEVKRYHLKNEVADFDAVGEEMEALIQLDMDPEPHVKLRTMAEEFVARGLTFQRALLDDDYRQVAAPRMKVAEMTYQAVQDQYTDEQVKPRDPTDFIAFKWFMKIIEDMEKAEDDEWNSCKIFWLEDSLGGIGKSTTAAYAAAHAGARVLGSEDPRDLALLIKPTDNIFIFDMARSTATYPIKMMEELGNGSFVSPKYLSKRITLLSPKRAIIVFANSYPTELSAHRVEHWVYDAETHTINLSEL